MRFGVFKLAYKTSKEIVDGEAVKQIYRLVYKDALGNLLNVNGTEDDWTVAEVGEVLPWKTVSRQRTLEEAEERDDELDDREVLEEDLKGQEAED